ncbi:unnamed protein product [Lampetra planeri]
MAQAPRQRHRYFVANGRLLLLPPCCGNTGSEWADEPALSHRDRGGMPPCPASSSSDWPQPAMSLLPPRAPLVAARARDCGAGSRLVAGGRS